MSMEECKLKKKEHDFAVIAFRAVKEATGRRECEYEPPQKAKEFDDKALVHKVF